MAKSANDLITPEPMQPLSTSRKKRCLEARRFGRRRYMIVGRALTVLFLILLAMSAFELFFPWTFVLAMTVMSVLLLMGLIHFRHQKVAYAVLDEKAHYRDGRPWFCLNCSYPFKGATLADNRCPECGEAFERMPKGNASR